MKPIPNTIKTIEALERSRLGFGHDNRCNDEARYTHLDRNTVLMVLPEDIMMYTRDKRGNWSLQGQYHLNETR